MPLALDYRHFYTRLLFAGGRWGFTTAPHVWNSHSPAIMRSCKSLRVGEVEVFLYLWTRYTHQTQAVTRKQRETRQTVAKWATRNRHVLLVPGVLVVLVVSLGLVLSGRGMMVTLVILVTAFLAACTALTIAIARIVELLKAIRNELATIRAHVDTGLLDDIATDLTAVRTQMGKGVLGLLGV